MPLRSSSRVSTDPVVLRSSSRAVQEPAPTGSGGGGWSVAQEARVAALEAQCARQEAHNALLEHAVHAALNTADRLAAELAGQPVGKLAQGEPSRASTELRLQLDGLPAGAPGGVVALAQAQPANSGGADTPAMLRVYCQLERKFDSIARDLVRVAEECTAKCQRVDDVVEAQARVARLAASDVAATLRAEMEEKAATEARQFAEHARATGRRFDALSEHVEIECGTFNEKLVDGLLALDSKTTAIEARRNPTSRGKPHLS